MSQYPPPPAPSSQWPDQQPPPPVYGGGAAPNPIPRYSVQPRPQRRRHTGLIVLGVIVGVLVLLVAVGAAAGGRKNGTHVSKANHPTATGQPAAPAARQPKGEKQFALGETGEVSNDGKVAGTVTVSDPKATQKAPDEYSKPPAKGWFVTLTVTAKATGSATFDVNPFNFYVRGSDGQHYEYGDGNSIEAGGDGDLNAATLNPGETVKGTVTFDVPDQHGVLVYAPALGRALASWTF